MDRIDRQIVHCLQRDGRASFRRIAAVVGVSEQTFGVDRAPAGLGEPEAA